MLDRDRGMLDLDIISLSVPPINFHSKRFGQYQYSMQLFLPGLRSVYGQSNAPKPHLTDRCGWEHHDGRGAAAE